MIKADEVMTKSPRDWSAEEATAVQAALDEMMEESRVISKRCREIAEAVKDNKLGKKSAAVALEELVVVDDIQQKKRRAYLRAFCEYLGMLS